ncbi:MAG: MFS transporter [Candidatus Heimdallarchaeota archaeon]
MENNSSKLPILSIVLLITIVTLIYTVSNMVSPNLLIISAYFGFGGNTTPLGTLVSTFTIISGLTMLLFGYLADKLIRKWIVLIGTLNFSIFAFLTILVPSGISGFFLFYFLSIMTGIGFGALIPNIFSLIGDIVTQGDRSKGFSFFSISTLVGGIVGVGLATFTGTIDWRLSYFIIGISGFIGSSLFIFFKEPSRIGKDYSYLVQRDAIDYTYRIKFSDLKVIFKKKANVWLAINFVDTIPTGIILFLLFAYMEDFHGIPANEAIIYLLLILLATLIGTIVFGFIGDQRFKKGNKKARVKLAILGNLLPIPFVFISLIIPFRAPNIFPGILIMLILFMIGMFSNGAVSGNWYATVVDLNLPEHRGTILATSNFFDIIGRSIGPIVGAVVADTLGFVYGMMISIFFWILIPLFWIPVLRNLLPEMEGTEKMFAERIESITKK